jgi:hypothetical protein
MVKETDSIFLRVDSTAINQLKTLVEGNIKKFQVFKLTLMELCSHNEQDKNTTKKTKENASNS